MQVWNIAGEVDRDDLAIAFAVLIESTDKPAGDEACFAGVFTQPHEIAARPHPIDPSVESSKGFQFARQE